MFPSPAGSGEQRLGLFPSLPWHPVMSRLWDGPQEYGQRSWGQQNEQQWQQQRQQQPPALRETVEHPGFASWHHGLQSRGSSENYISLWPGDLLLPSLVSIISWSPPGCILRVGSSQVPLTDIWETQAISLSTLCPVLLPFCFCY